VCDHHQCSPGFYGGYGVHFMAARGEVTGSDGQSHGPGGDRRFSPRKPQGSAGRCEEIFAPPRPLSVISPGALTRQLACPGFGVYGGTPPDFYRSELTSSLFPELDSSARKAGSALNLDSNCWMLLWPKNRSMKN